MADCRGWVKPPLLFLNDAPIQHISVETLSIINEKLDVDFREFLQPSKAEKGLFYIRVE